MSMQSACTPMTRKEINDMLGIQELNLEPEEKLQISELICEYADVFALNQSELGHTDVIHHSIDTGDSPPLRQPVRRIPFALRAKVEEMVDGGARGNTAIS